MKKSTGIILVFILSLACDLSEKSTYVEKMVPLPEGIVKAHIAVFDGPIAEENLVLKTYVTNAKPSINVPLGKDMRFLTLYENADGKAAEYGTATMSVSEGGSDQLVITMDDITTALGLPADDFDDTLVWNDINAETYNVYHTNSLITPVYTLIYSGTDLQLVHIYSGNGYLRMDCYFSYFDMYSVPSNTIGLGP